MCLDEIGCYIVSRFTIPVARLNRDKLNIVITFKSTACPVFSCFALCCSRQSFNDGYLTGTNFLNNKLRPELPLLSKIGCNESLNAGTGFFSRLDIHAGPHRHNRDAFLRSLCNARNQIIRSNWRNSYGVIILGQYGLHCFQLGIDVVFLGCGKHINMDAKFPGSLLISLLYRNPKRIFLFNVCF